MTDQLVSLLGLVVMMLLAWLLSPHKTRISLRIVVGGLALQFLLAAFILRTELGRDTFQKLGDLCNVLLSAVNVGCQAVFGPKFADFYFAFKVLPTIIFFSSLMSLLYYFGVMQRVIQAVAWVMQRTLGTSGAESLSAAANIFVGQTEAPLVIRPYVASMTQSELMAVMVGGFATISGSVLAAYVGMGISATHLIAASVISAPAGLLIAKLMQPEVEIPKTRGTVELDAKSEAVNFIDAAARGASDGLRLALNVAAMLIAFLALAALADMGVRELGRLCGQTWSLERGLGLIFAPLAWLMGVPWQDCEKVGELLGYRTMTNEFVAYDRLSVWLKGDEVKLQDRSVTIVSYALCGFANFGSIGIQIGGIGSLAPERQGDLARLGLRAMIGGMLACFMTACIAGMLL